ncbi:MAG: NAD-dependent DNA ligase LigA [Saprospiraceae bacterium]|nr:NAD-dependent DNA ligase LigA [Saprospiraceae bacterium]
MYSAERQQTLNEISKKILSDKGYCDSLIPAELADELKELIKFHEWRYYIINDPLISDYEYDLLYKKLQQVELQHPDLVQTDSPTQRVSTDVTKDLPVVNHLTPMLSLANSYDLEDLVEFDNQVRKLTGLDKDSIIEYCVEPKFDGGSIAVVFENDVLTRAATRGDGQAGEDITNNIKSLKSVPAKAEFSRYKMQKVELRGEALIRKDQFLKINAQREEDGLNLFANPRNAATGGLRTKDPQETADRKIEAFIYQLGYAIDEQGSNLLNQLSTHDQSIELLGKLGFKIPEKERKVCKGIHEVESYCQQWQKQRDSFEYEIDGMVIKVNDRKLQDLCGYTSHHPRWAIAFKFQAKQATSRLINVEFQIGKMGAITPVAKVEPVQLAGVTVGSISLHNEEFIQSRDIMIGDMVLLERAGDVIPYIVKALPDLRTGNEKPIEFPANCPSCQTPLVRIQGEAAWRCPNEKCGEKIIQKLIFHVSKDAMDIDGMGESNIRKFHELGWINNMADIYNLDFDAIANLEGFGKKSAENLKSAILKAKKNPIHRFLHSLSIHHLGKKASKLIAQRIDNIMDLKEWTLEDYLLIKDIGPVVAENTRAYFSNPENIELLERIESLGVNFMSTREDKPTIVEAETLLSGKTILFTGTLSKMGRKDAEILAEKAGAKNLSAVSSNLNILVVGENAGSKLEKARKIGTVEILTEDQFIELMNHKA